mgnify:CR=1 FL=1
MIESRLKKGLGRGLSSLLGDSSKKIETNKVSINDLTRNKFQPRKSFSKESLEELSNSIKEQGIIQPIVVRPDKTTDGKYEIIAGERRWLAAQKANLYEVPVVILNVDDLKSLLDHLEVEKTTLVGQSMGGGTCVCFTYQYPERVSSLVIADSLHGFEEPDDVAVVMDKSRQETSSLSQLERVLGAKVRNEDPVAGILYSALNSFNATNRSNLSGSYGPKCTPGELAETGVPILFVAGSGGINDDRTTIRSRKF